MEVLRQEIDVDGLGIFVEQLSDDGNVILGYGLRKSYQGAVSYAQEEERRQTKGLAPLPGAPNVMFRSCQMFRLPPAGSDSLD